MRRRSFLSLALGGALATVGGFYGWDPKLGTGSEQLAGWTIKHRFSTGITGAYSRSELSTLGELDRLIREDLQDWVEVETACRRSDG